MADNEISALQEKLAKICEETDDLNSRYLALEQMNEEVKNINIEIEDLNKKREDSQNIFRNQLDDLNNEIESAKNELNSLITSQNDRTNELEKQIQEISNLNTQKERKLSQITQNKSNASQNQSNVLKYKALQAEPFKFNEILTFEERNGDISLYFQQIETQISELLKKKASLSDSIPSKEKRIRTNTKFSNHLTEKCEKLENQYQLSISKLAETKQNIESLNILIADQQKQVESAKLQKTNLQTKYSETKSLFKSEYSSTLSSIDSKTSDICLLKERFEKIESDLNSRESELRDELSRVEAENDELSREIGSLEQGDKAEDVAEDMQSSIEKIKSNMEPLTVRIEKYRKDIDSIQTDLRTLDEAIDFQILKKKPSKKFLSKPKFAMKKILLEELIVQNFKISCEIAIYMDKLGQAEQYIKNHPELFKKDENDGERVSDEVKKEKL